MAHAESAIRPKAKAITRTRRMDKNFDVRVNNEGGQCKSGGSKTVTGIEWLSPAKATLSEPTCAMVPLCSPAKSCAVDDFPGCERLAREPSLIAAGDGLRGSPESVGLEHRKDFRSIFCDIGCDIHRTFRSQRPGKI